MILVFRYATRVNFLYSALAVLMGELVWDITEALVMDFRLAATGLNKAYVLNNMTFVDNIYNFIYIEAICLFVFFILVKYDYNIKRTLLKRGILHEQLTYKHILPIVVLLFASIMFVFTMEGYFFSFYEKVSPEMYWQFLQVIDVFMFIGLIVFVYLGISRTLANIADENSKNTAEEHLRNVEHMILSIRKQRHDFNSHLQTIHGLIKTGEIDQAKKYIGSTMSSVASSNILTKTDNPIVSSLIYSKVGLAELKNISVELSILGSLKNLPLSDYELNSIIGNLLDNATEAMDRIDTPNKRVVLNITRDKKSLSISTQNNCNVTEEEVTHFLQPNYSTKGQTGLGVSIIKDITEKHGGRLEVWVESNTITFDSNIPLIA
jgi:hypothetical protein